MRGCRRMKILITKRWHIPAYWPSLEERLDQAQRNDDRAEWFWYEFLRSAVYETQINFMPREIKVRHSR